MEQAWQDLEAFLVHGFDTVIDVRSPAEFAEDHVPGAINLPVLDNEERARVGTLYKQVSPFKARKLGAALVVRNAAAHLETTLADHDGGWRPLLYCWRGGQRSGAFAWLLREIGWRAETVPGGYKTYRRLVVSCLYDRPCPWPIIQLGGHTGTAKTEILAHLAQRGVQVIDLEALAHHRGSLLGAYPEPQPSQKAFETAVARALLNCDPLKPVIVEAESSKIGHVSIPPALWQAMQAAPWIMVDAPIAERSRYLARAYADILADAPRLKAQLAPLRRYRGSSVFDRWMALIDAGDRVGLCRALARDHYDPAYAKAMRAQVPEVVGTVQVPDLSGEGLQAASAEIDAVLQTIET